MIKQLKLPTIVGIIVLVLGIGAGVFLIQYRQIFRLKASPDITPQDVRITNVSDKSFTVSWITDKASVGYVIFGESESSISQEASGSQDSANNIHSVNVAALKQNTEYFFKINSDGKVIDNSGIPWKVKTAPAISGNPAAGVISGSVLDAGGKAVGEALVYINSAGVAPLSAKTSANGTWVLPLANARSTNLSTRASLGPDSLLEIFVQAGPKGVSTAQVYVSGAGPIPPMILNQTHDFKDQKSVPSDGLPTSNVNIPTNDNQSKFSAPEEAVTPPAPTTVTLESIDPGEEIFTTQPEFFGEGPRGMEISIVIESDPVKGTVTVGSDGEWSWTPPTNLAPGTHKITISWKDASGLLRTLTRTFTVLASEGPAFESTPSATPKTTPTATPKTSATPKSSASPSSTPKTSVPVTDSGTPIAGSVAPTIILTATGMGLIVLGLTLAIKLKYDS